MDDNTRTDKSDGQAGGAELSDAELDAVSGGFGPAIKVPPVRINLAPGPDLAIVPDTQHGDPHVSE